MHSGRPLGRLTYGVELSPEEAAAAEHLMRQMSNLKAASGLDSFKLVRDLPGGGTAIAQDAGGVTRLIVTRPQESESEFGDGLAKDYIPMLFSGHIDRGFVGANEGVTLRVTQQTRKRLAGYSPDAKLPPERLTLMRFAIPHANRFSELTPKRPVNGLFTQYANQRPTWYSGAMAQAVQIVGGYGRQRLGSLPDDPIERARFTLPAFVADEIRKEIGNTRLPGYSGLPPAGGQFSYEYKFHGTHGVSYDVTGKPWLVEVNRRGVFVMPMPMIPATTTMAFRRYVEEVNDTELLWALDRFGGLPSGEAFPSGEEAFEAWRRAGVIIKVCETGDFYNLYPYSIACGWSFNLNGTEAFNTCWGYQEQGIKVGAAYKMSLALGPAHNDGKLPVSFDMQNPGDQAKLDGYLSTLYQALRQDTARNLAIKYKLRRSDPKKLIARAGLPVASEIAYWDAFEAEPIATHAGNVAAVHAGALYHGAKPKRQPQFKFPDPLQDGCISFDFTPYDPSVVPPGYLVRCDTIMFGWYVGNDLKVAKYFLDTRWISSNEESDFEDCMIVGSWTRTVNSGVISIQGNFYTSDFDEREAYPTSKRVTRITGEDMGYDTKPFFEFDHFFARPGTLLRHRYYKSTVETTQEESRAMMVAVCVPYLERNAILHAKKEFVGNRTWTYSVGRGQVRDPTTYRYWTHDHIFAWVGGLEDTKGQPGPKDGNPVWVEHEQYSPGGCSDFADQGPWIPGLPADYTWLIHPSRHEWLHSGGGGAPPLEAIHKSTASEGEESGEVLLSVHDAPATVSKSVPDQGYFEMSPSEGGDVFYRDVIATSAGEAVYASVSEHTQDKLRKYYGYTARVDHKSPHHFIGVINE